ncbi:MAG: CCA tRNA nucleotidyltransferase [Acidobacteria bacterium]|nr:CCA tRNA nucleotidyltransferase [Acidobacteriota bacterium]
MSDYNFLMESRLSPEQYRVINHLSRIAASQGVNFYLVGGAVRDLTYGQQVIRDLDFAAEGNVQKILRHLGKRGSRQGRAGGEPDGVEVERLRFNTRLNSAEITFEDGVRAEVSMSRDEVYAKPGRRPEVSPAMIFDDLKRRDFSVNAMAVSLHPNSRGLLLDPTNGAADIERRELRVLHNRSLSEDPSRIYRLLRLGARLRFTPEERTKILLDAALENRLWQRLDPDLQARELTAILHEENPGRALKTLAARGLLTGLDKKLASAKISYECFNKIRSVAQTIPGADPFLVNFICLVERLGDGQRKRLAKKIIGDSKAMKMALGLEGAGRKLARVLASSKAALPSQGYVLLTGQPLPLLLLLLVKYPRPQIQKRIKGYLFKAPIVRAQLPRADLQALGVQPGPKFEKMLEQVFFEQLDGKIKTHQQLMKRFRALAGIKEPPPKPAKPAQKAKAAEPTKTPPPKAAKASKPTKTSELKGKKR